MAVQMAGATAANIQEVDASFKASRSSLRPPEALGWFSLSGKSGLLTGLAAAAPVFALRNSGTNLLMVRRIGIGFLTTTLFTTAQIVDFQLQVARAFTVSDSAGTPIVMTGSNGKHRTSLPAPTSMDARIAAAAALTAGTRTLDAVPISMQAGWSGAAGQGIAPGTDNLFAHNASDYPLILAANEGLVISAIAAFGALGGGNLYVNLEFAESTAF